MENSTNETSVNTKIKEENEETKLGKAFSEVFKFGKIGEERRYQNKYGRILKWQNHHRWKEQFQELLIG